MWLWTSVCQWVEWHLYIPHCSNGLCIINCNTNVKWHTYLPNYGVMHVENVSVFLYLYSVHNIQIVYNDILTLHVHASITQLSSKVCYYKMVALSAYEMLHFHQWSHFHHCTKTSPPLLYPYLPTNTSISPSLHTMVMETQVLLLS